MKRHRYISAIKRFSARALLGLILVFLSIASFGQQDPIYTQYVENLQMLNPAYAGSKEALSLMLVARNQWVSLPDAPDTRSLAIHSPVKNTQMAVGFSLLRDKVGPVTQTGFYADYAYRIFLGEKETLSLGIKGGINFYDANLTTLETVNPYDPVFAYDINRQFLPNFGIGALYYGTRFYLGISLPKLIENKINKNETSTQTVSREQIHAFFMGGYVYDINRIVKFKPSILGKFVANAPISLDLNGTFLFYDRLWLGAMYRTGDALGGLVQMQITNQLKVGYSYDLPINKLGAYNNGTHEVMISFDFNFGSARVRSPRYF